MQIRSQQSQQEIFLIIWWLIKKFQLKRITNDRFGRTVAELFKEEENIQKLIVNEGFGEIHKRYAYQCDWIKNSE